VFDVAMTQCQSVVRDGEGNAVRSCMFLADHDGPHSYVIVVHDTTEVRDDGER
jgi:hypothetical protein